MTYCTKVLSVVQSPSTFSIVNVFSEPKSFGFYKIKSTKETKQKNTPQINRVKTITILLGAPEFAYFWRLRLGCMFKGSIQIYLSTGF